MSTNYFLIICCSVLLIACDVTDQVGPDIEAIGATPSPTGDFTASVDTVNLREDETVFFEQSFEEPTHWLITLKGLNSRASKTFESLSSSINASNSLWDGQVNSPPYFQAEQVEVTLSYPDYPDEKISIDTVYIEAVSTHLIEAVLFTDFENSPLYNFGSAEPAGGGWGSDWPVTSNTNTSYPLYDDNAYLYIAGAPWQTNNPYVDITEIPVSTGDTITSNYLPLYSDPDRVYINIAVYNTGTENTWFQIQLSENHNGGVARSWNIRPNWEGWKYISIKYSDLISDDTSQYNPQIVNKIALLLFSDQPSSETQEEVSVAIDQLVFSFDSPLGTITK